jgi:catechol 2,3-dioxygenase-like lactoylglutathione lyase family enzyme
MNQPVLKGVHHTARPTWKLRETVEFYRDKLGLKLVHAISAKGWGPEGHPDFLHFFFDSGQGSTIAFFYYIGAAQPDYLVHKPQWDCDSVHTAWQVDSEKDLLEWKSFLESRGVKVDMHIRHELIESIYFRDPNGYLVEIGRQLREMTELDERDASMTLEAAIAAETEARAGGERFGSIESVWQRKGALQRKALR